jgi:hypothetical protein
MINIRVHRGVVGCSMPLNGRGRPAARAIVMIPYGARDAREAAEEEATTSSTA